MVEFTFAAIGGGARGAALAALGPFGLASGCLVIVHWIIGTAHILATILPSFVVGALFQATYVTALWLADKSRKASRAASFSTKVLAIEI
jgi:hypothetical protein